MPLKMQEPHIIHHPMVLIKHPGGHKPKKPVSGKPKK